MTDMSMTSGVGRTYKFWRGSPLLWEFGFGLSYSNFTLSLASAFSVGSTKLPGNRSALRCAHAEDTLHVTVSLRHASSVVNGTAEEVVFVYHVPNGTYSGKGEPV